MDDATQAARHAELMSWRKTLRTELLARRMSVPAERIRAWRIAMDRHLRLGFPGLGQGVVAFCWPIRGEYDARHLLARLRSQGTVTALPVVLAPKQPLVFREWHPGTPMATGSLDIPYPAAGEALIPNTVLLPMNGFDRAGFRLGYGGGFFDRTLEALAARRPAVIGVSYELAAIESIRPQAWDQPVDYVVTERGVYQRLDGRLDFLGVPRTRPDGLASPVCYAQELDPDYFGEPDAP